MVAKVGDLKRKVIISYKDQKEVEAGERSLWGIRTITRTPHLGMEELFTGVCLLLATARAIVMEFA